MNPQLAVTGDMDRSVVLLDKRIASLEELSSKIVRGGDLRDQKIVEAYSLFKESLSLLRTELESVQNQLTLFKKDLRDIVAEFKDVVKQEDLERVKARVDEVVDKDLF